MVTVVPRPTSETGAVAQRMTYDGSGQLLSGSLMDYALPQSDRALPVETVILEVAPDHGRFGAKGVGEPPVVAAPAAIANAVADALGRRFTRQLGPGAADRRRGPGAAAARGSLSAYSPVATCKAHGIDPWAYLRDVLERIPTHPNPRRAELLPRNWKTAQPIAPA